jgi:hypothetical protein
MSRIHTAVTLVLTAAFLTAQPALAFHTVFSYQVDRVEADGNNFGRADGVPDFVDDFDDGVLGPNFGVAFGSAHESGGSLFLTSPGTHFPAPDGSGLDLTVVAHIGPRLIEAGFGDLTATAYWVPILPALGQHWHFSLYAFGENSFLDNETFGLGIRRTATGLEIDQHLIELDVAGGTYRNTLLDVVPIADADVTGEIGFRIHYANATSTATTEFSLDGGTTWQSPFPVAPVFSYPRYQAQLILSADPSFGDPRPTTTTTTTSTTTTTTTLPTSCPVEACRRSILPAKGRVAVKLGSNGKPDTFRWKWQRGQATDLSDFGTPTRFTSYELCLADGAGDVIAVNVPAGGSCRLRPCWTQVGTRGHRFKDADGQQHGIRQITLRAGTEGHAAIAVRAKGDLELPPLPLALPLTVRLRNSDGQCWAGTFSAAGVQRNEAGKFSGRAD